VDKPVKSVMHGLTYDYLPSRLPSLPCGRYQIMLLGRRKKRASDDQKESHYHIDIYM